MPERMLIVEDDDTLRRMIAARLAYAGYDVVQAASGEAALELLKCSSFHVVLSDIVLGGLDGLAVLRAARTCPEPAAVVLLTGQATVETAVQALRGGAHDYLLKPCDVDELLVCLAGAAQRTVAERRGATGSGEPAGSTVRRQEDARLVVGELQIGASRHDVLFRGRQVTLTPTEYALLRYLAEHTGQVRRYSDIVAHVQQFTVPDDEARHLLRTHYTNLRQKLSPEYFVTDRGTGLMLVPPPPASQVP